MSKLEKMKCPYCEGTGKKINRFDPPISEDVYYREGPDASIKNVTTRGREIEEDPCPNCNGALEVYDI